MEAMMQKLLGVPAHQWLLACQGAAGNKGHSEGVCSFAQQGSLSHAHVS